MSENRPLADDLGFLLSRASGAVARSVSEVLTPLGLRMRSYSILALAVESERGVAQRRLAAIIGLDPSQLVALVDELEERGLVVRAPDPDDRRNKLIRATEEGCALYGRAHSEVIAQDDHLFRQVPVAKRDELRKMLRQVAFGGAEISLSS